MMEISEERYQQAIARGSAVGFEDILEQVENSRAHPILLANVEGAIRICELEQEAQRPNDDPDGISTLAIYNQIGYLLWMFSAYVAADEEAIPLFNDLDGKSIKITPYQIQHMKGFLQAVNLDVSCVLNIPVIWESRLTFLKLLKQVLSIIKNPPK